MGSWQDFLGSQLECVRCWLVLAEIPGGSLMGLTLLEQLVFYLGLEKATTTDSFHRLEG